MANTEQYKRWDVEGTGMESREDQVQQVVARGVSTQRAIEILYEVERVLSNL